MASIAYLLRWWLAAELIGLCALPLAWRIFRRLPDHGHGFARALGLLLLTYTLWLGGTLGVLPFSTGSAVLALAALALLGLWLFAREREAILAWLGESKRYALFCEAVFLVVFLLVAFLRSYQPAIAGTEKPFEYANYNAVTRSAAFAPTDPWLAGKPMAYYYLGYVAVGGVAKLTATPPSYAFNVSLALVAGLTAVTIFALAANAAALLVARGDLRHGWPLVAGALAVVFLLVIGNLAGLFELTAAHGWLPASFYGHLDILGLKPTDLPQRVSPHWYPENFFGAPWRTTRLGSDWNFLEYPAFSFLLGDLHPHVLALPFKLLAAGLGLALLTAEALPRPGAWRAGLLPWAMAALGIGMLVGVHPWDYPVFLVLALVLIAARSLRSAPAEPEARVRILRDTAMSASAFVGLSLALFVPFFFGARGSVGGVLPTQVAYRNAGTVNAEGMFLPFQHLLLFWTPLMLPAGLFVARCLAERGWRGLRRYGLNALALVALLPLAWAFVIIAMHGGGGLRAELAARTWGWLTVVTLGLLLALTAAALWDEIAGEHDPEGGHGRLFLLAAIGVGVLMVYGPELFMVKDSSGTRANTTFKLWYCGWTLLSVAGATGGLYALWQWRPRVGFSLALRPAVFALSAAVLAGALAFPLYAGFTRTDGFKGGRTLDGLAFLKTANRDEYGAAAWLNANVPGVATVLEAVGESYQEPGRIASRTGLPTVLDWEFHEQQQRQHQAYFVTRREDVARIYTTTDPREAFSLLANYGVKYIVVGQPELQAYGNAGIAKFAGMGDTVYRSPGVTIYRIGTAPLYAVAP